ncbi:MAG: RNA-binding cell elongation regulator Jag/EloR [Oscillospiraceae bacterium]
MNEIIATGKTTDEAVEKACAELGLSRDEVSVEIIDMPQRKLFGMSPAKVKVTKIEDAFSVKDLFSETETKAAEPQRQQPGRAEQAPRPKNEQPIKAQTLAPRKEEPFQQDETEENIEISEIGNSATNALEYLKRIVQGIGAEKIEYKAVKTERGIKFLLDGDDASVIIGRRGETMDAIQYLCTLIGSRDDEDYCKISIDVANYRKKREKTLRSLAIREAAKVKKTRYNQTLEPMNPYERRIVHSAVQEIEGVKSESIGTEPNRRVVISLISGGRQGGGNHSGRPGSSDNKRGYSGRGSGQRDGARPSGDNFNRSDAKPQRPEQPKPVPEKTSAQKADELKPTNSVPLYGKIKL